MTTNDEVAKLFARVLAENGINAIDISGGVFEFIDMIIQPSDKPHGLFANNALMIRNAIKAVVPVIVAGNIKDPFTAKKILDDGKADMIAFGRAFLSDADFPKKVQTGRSAEINTCTGCNQGFIDRLFEGKDISCVINPE